MQEFKAHNQKAILSWKSDISKLASDIDELYLIAETYARIFKENPIPMAITRMIDGLFMEVNEAWTQALGYTREEMLGQTVQQLSLWKDFAEREIMVDNISKNGFINNLECSFMKKSGETRNHLFTAKIIDFDNVRCLLSIIVEIAPSE